MKAVETDIVVGPLKGRWGWRFVLTDEHGYDRDYKAGIADTKAEATAAARAAREEWENRHE